MKIGIEKGVYSTLGANTKEKSANASMNIERSVIHTSLAVFWRRYDT